MEIDPARTVPRRGVDTQPAVVRELPPTGEGILSADFEHAIGRLVSSVEPDIAAARVAAMLAALERTQNIVELESILNDTDNDVSGEPGVSLPARCGEKVLDVAGIAGAAADEEPGLVQKALRVAIEQHRGEVRRSTQAPYVTHPIVAMCVAVVLAEKIDSETLAIIALHDVLEDVPSYREADMREAFGDFITAQVRLNTKNSKIDDHKLQGDRLIEGLLSQGVDERTLVANAADKTHNIASIIRDKDVNTPEYGKMTDKKIQKKLNYFRSLCSVYEARIPAHPITGQMKKLIAEYVAIFCPSEGIMPQSA